MPKKFTGLNSKAAAAKARKDEKSEAERLRKQQEEEDALWKDDGDKNMQKKKERKEQQERKKAEQVEKKLERKKLMEEEEANLKSKSAKAPSNKLTRVEIRIRQVATAGPKTAEDNGQETHLTTEIQENLNRLNVTENEARNIEEAIDVLRGSSAPLEKHPEKRMKAAYEDFEKARLPELKADNPNLRLSQLKQMLRKEWMKHPSNPFNKNFSDYNAKRDA